MSAVSYQSPLMFDVVQHVGPFIQASADVMGLPKASVDATLANGLAMKVRDAADCNK